MSDSSDLTIAHENDMALGYKYITRTTPTSSKEVWEFSILWGTSNPIVQQAKIAFFRNHQVGLEMRNNAAEAKQYVEFASQFSDINTTDNSDKFNGDSSSSQKLRNWDAFTDPTPSSSSDDDETKLLLDAILVPLSEYPRGFTWSFGVVTIFLDYHLLGNSNKFSMLSPH